MFPGWLPESQMIESSGWELRSEIDGPKISRSIYQVNLSEQAARVALPLQCLQFFWAHLYTSTIISRTTIWAIYLGIIAPQQGVTKLTLFLAVCISRLRQSDRLRQQQRHLPRRISISHIGISRLLRDGWGIVEYSAGAGDLSGGLLL